MKKIYIGECEHLENCCITDDECLKRYIHIINPKKNNVECLVFCNDWLKLKAQQKSYENFTYKKNVVNVIENEILNYLNIEKKYRENTKSLSNYVFSFYVCQRPFTHVSINFVEIIQWYFDNPTQDMANLIIENIKCFLDHLYYEKYKTKYKSLITLSNKLKYNYNKSLEDKELIILELINETFKLTIKDN